MHSTNIMDNMREQGLPPLQELIVEVDQYWMGNPLLEILAVNPKQDDDNQFLPRFGFNAGGEPVAGSQALWLAVLERAIRDYFDDPRHSHTKQARLWIHSPSTQAFSFVWYCEALHLDASYLRQLILKKEEHDDQGE